MYSHVICSEVNLCRKYRYKVHYSPFMHVLCGAPDCLCYACICGPAGGEL